MRKIYKLASVICSFCFSQIHLSSQKAFSSIGNNFLQNSRAVTIKIDCAGSGRPCPMKVMTVDGVPSISNGDYIFPSVQCKDSSLGSNLKYKDMSLFSPQFFINDSGSPSINFTSAIDSKFKKNDFFFEIKDEGPGKKKLKISRPGGGADSIFSGEKTIFPPGTFDMGQFSVPKTSNLLKKLILECIDNAVLKGYDLNFILKGKSRGAIALLRSMSDLLAELNSDFYINKLVNTKVSLNCALFDPVCGPDVSNKSFDLCSKNSSVTLKLTQVISTDTGAPWYLQNAFSSSAYVPTDKNLSTLIFVPFGHSVSLENISLDQTTEKYHKTMWDYDGKLLKNGEIVNLDPGVYFSTSPFYVVGQKNPHDKDAIALSKDWRIASNNGTPIIPPVKLRKLTSCDKDSLHLMQKSLLMTPDWVKNCNRKSKILKLLDKSLHINHVLKDNQSLDFNNDYSLVLKTTNYE